MVVYLCNDFKKNLERYNTIQEQKILKESYLKNNFNKNGSKYPNRVAR